ncbi:hypothetical protein [Bacillus sp. T33-2]|uniref:hypothetical protein n=1 Tax=Bacillus sp. T33-2 TaxID=2054168 RepID=UPI000C78B9C3|nr:hypothetical protein [Bacillus sp. T33-2]PLR94639.1 hypothetical protein CVD19_16875 [Bacillus sp. T33-2]
MRKIKLSDLNEVIERNRSMVNKQIAKLSSPKRKKRNRVRSKGEREALDQISVRKWKKALVSGKVRKISDKVWYYDYRD